MMKPINPVTGQAATDGVPRHGSGDASSVAEASGLDSAGRDRTAEVGQAVADDELWPCSDCGWTALPCECFFAQSCPDCGEDWDWCECEREL